MSEQRPLPLPDETSVAFWEAASEGRLAIYEGTLDFKKAQAEADKSKKAPAA